jgi:hypothetical protein
MKIETGLDNIGTLFGRPIGQYWEDLEFWEQTLNDFDHLEWIIELGTYQGGMSFYLYSQAWARRMKFYTVDIDKPNQHVPCFYNIDITKGLPRYWDFFQTEPGILFCDNGDKPSEVYQFYNQLHKESLIMVHDWGTEFTTKDIPASMRVYDSSTTTVLLARNDWLNERSN